MLTINPIKLYTFNKKYITFGEDQEKKQNNRIGLMSLEKNQNTKINKIARFAGIW